MFLNDSHPVLFTPAGTTGTTAANFTQPATGAYVNVQFTSTTWLLPGEHVLITDSTNGGTYRVGNIISSTHANILNLGTGTPSSVAGTVVDSGASVTPVSPQPQLDIALTANSIGNDAVGALTTTYVIQFTGSSPTGTLVAQVSNNLPLPLQTSAAGPNAGWQSSAPVDTDASWTTVSALFDGAAATSLSVSATGNHTVSVAGYYRWVRLGWTKSSGTGTMTAIVLGVGPN